MFLCKMQKRESDQEQASNRQKEKARKVIQKHTHKQKPRY